MNRHSKNENMKILVHLSNLFLCEALGRLLLQEPEGYQVLATNNLQKVGDFRPSKIIVDVHSLNEELVFRWPDAKFLLVDTGLREEEIVSLLLSYRLDGVIKTDTDLPLFKKALHAIDAGQVWIDNSRIRSLLTHVEDLSAKKSTHSLSKKERDIVVLVSQGCRNREIADKLCISEQTVKAHISRIFRKVNVTCRSQLVPLAMKYKITEML